MPLPYYPDCPVPDAINPDHNGGGILGPLFRPTRHTKNVGRGRPFKYPYACAKCFEVEEIIPGSEVQKQV